MQRSLVLASILLVALLAGLAWWLLGTDAPPPVAPSGPALATVAQPAVAAATAGPGPGEAGAAQRREAAAAQLADPTLDDPEIRAGLCGFKGRVVDHDKKPVAECGVRIYRGAMDTVIPANIDWFATEPTHVPSYIAGEARTAADGTWQLTGVWPRALYLMFAGIGTDAPMHQVLTRSPAPGEIVDLGDIVLPLAGVITGVVVDDEGEPLPGALVRAADLPGTLAALFPVERFDPEGCVLIREPQSPVRVVEMPPWVKNAFDHLPIPSTRADGEGRFRLVGVVPGSNMLATTMRGFLSDVKPSVQVRAGQEKDVGRIRMKRGEELVGKVVDTAGKPVADAEVLAGSTLTIAPFDLAQRIGSTDGEGRFAGQGFAPGKVTVAARRKKGHAWVLAEPQSVNGDVLVTLPATFTVDVTVTLTGGEPAKAPRLQLLQGRAGEGAGEMFMLGLSPPMDLRTRRKDLGDGRCQLTDLAAGNYTLIADAPGRAAAVQSFEITTADTSVALELGAPSVYVVRVLGPEDRPIRNAAIFVEARGARRVANMPLNCGRTGADGRLTIDKVQGETIRVSADHPKWGVVHGEAKLGVELELRMHPPGSLRGVVTENGKPPQLGKFTISVEYRRGDGPRGPIETVPLLLTPDLDGAFASAALQPGQYSVQAIPALDALRSPGGIFSLVQDAYLSRDLPREQVQVASGGTTEVRLEAGTKPIEGPTARLAGSVLVDGRVGAGHVVTANAKGRRFSARVDDRGRFDIGTVPAGDLRVGLMASGEGMLFGPNNNLWSSSIELAEAEARELTIEVQTSTVAGVCMDPAGGPAAGVQVHANGRLAGGGGGNAWMSTTANAQGEFQFTKVAAGTWSFDARGGREPMRGQLRDVKVEGGAPVAGLTIAMQMATVVKGRVDLASLGAKKTQWAWISFHRLADTDPPTANGQQAAGVGLRTENGGFTTNDLAPGRYRLQLHMQPEGGPSEQYPLDVLVVPAAGLTDVVLRPGPRITR
jgi:hypothetical protein